MIILILLLVCIAFAFLVSVIGYKGVIYLGAALLVLAAVATPGFDMIDVMRLSIAGYFVVYALKTKEPD